MVLAVGAFLPLAARAQPTVHPGTAALRAFAEEAQQRLPAKALRPFAGLLQTLPPPAKAPGVFVSIDATKNISCVGGVCTPTAARAVLNVGELTRRLADGSVTIATSGQAPDIYINAPFSWTSANGLTLQAIANITVNQAVSDAGPGALTLTYNANGGGGTLSFGRKGHISFLSTGNALTINGSNYFLANNVQTLAQLIARNPSGHFALAASYDARPDGKYTHSPILTKFRGYFEGLGNSITRLKVEDKHGTETGGLFSVVGNLAYVTNVHVILGRLLGRRCVGGVVGVNHGYISSSVEGPISAFSPTGDVKVGGVACKTTGASANRRLL